LPQQHVGFCRPSQVGRCVDNWLLTLPMALRAPEDPSIPQDLRGLVVFVLPDADQPGADGVALSTADPAQRTTKSCPGALIAGLAIYAFASTMSAFATNAEALIAWRALAGLGAAACLPIGLYSNGELSHGQRVSRVRDGAPVESPGLFVGLVDGVGMTTEVPAIIAKAGQPTGLPVG
jgi:hypothetical protein